MLIVPADSLVMSVPALKIKISSSVIVPTPFVMAITPSVTFDSSI
jgi:hypothetical protein